MDHTAYLKKHLGSPRFFHMTIPIRMKFRSLRAEFMTQ
jgi:hypothetical protein